MSLVNKTADCFTTYWRHSKRRTRSKTKGTTYSKFERDIVVLMYKERGSKLPLFFCLLSEVDTCFVCGIEKQVEDTQVGFEAVFVRKYLIVRRIHYVGQ